MTESPPPPDAPPADVAPTLPMALLRAREAVMTRVRPMLRAHGVTEQQWRVLRALADAGPLDAAQLARRAFLLRPSLVRILRDMQARGLVERVASSTSPKRSLCAVTAQGRALLDDTADDTAAIQAEIERIYGAGALAELKRNLEALERILTRSR
jgi:homoprotocatechuate degradation regulator HpaR